MIFMIDNYDSFTYNLVQYFQEMGQKVRVRRNDKVSTEDIERMKPDYLVISPGPGVPQDAGISVEAVRTLAGRLPILGVCLGHQAIGFAFGAKIGLATRLMHGKVSRVRHDGRSVFKGLENPLLATRYHSLAIRPTGLPPCLHVTATSEDGEIMGVRHKKLPVEGVQFHPESILTTSGKRLLENFLTSYTPGRTGKVT
jgi:anthranilate synthase/aminodeoxychorismate synthase-like glutamine amidotransferase